MVKKMEPIFFETCPLETVWGSAKLKNYFGFENYSDHVGQTWCFACQGENTNVVCTGIYKGRLLSDLWDNEKQLFQSEYTDFPFIVALLGPGDDLSIQVHPSALYAKQKGFTDGKNEAWYFIEPPDENRIVYGHLINTPDDFAKALMQNEIINQLDYLPITKDDFVYIPAGQLHACKKGCVVYEISQSTNITYRVNDYDRIGIDGKKRPLNIQEAIDCVSVPSVSAMKKVPKIQVAKDYTIKVYDDQDDFIVNRVELNGTMSWIKEKYQLVSVIYGKGYVNDIPISIGDSFLVPVNSPIVFNGNMIIMIASEK